MESRYGEVCWNRWPKGRQKRREHSDRSVSYITANSNYGNPPVVGARWFQTVVSLFRRHWLAVLVVTLARPPLSVINIPMPWTAGFWVGGLPTRYGGRPTRHWTHRVPRPAAEVLRVWTPLPSRSREAARDWNRRRATRRLHRVDKRICWRRLVRPVWSVGGFRRRWGFQIFGRW